MSPTPPPLPWRRIRGVGMVAGLADGSQIVIRSEPTTPAHVGRYVITSGPLAGRRYFTQQDARYDAEIGPCVCAPADNPYAVCGCLRCLVDADDQAHCPDPWNHTGDSWCPACWAAGLEDRPCGWVVCEHGAWPGREDGNSPPALPAAPLDTETLE